MARTVEEVIAAAMQLTEAERRVVVDELLATSALRKEDVVSELQRRAALWKTGEVTDVDSDELFAELRARRQ